MTAVIESYIVIDANSIAWVADTRIKVIEIALDKLAHGSSPEELHFQYPHLSMAQIHAALAYYYDHQEELAARQDDSPLRQKLRRLRLENER